MIRIGWLVLLALLAVTLRPAAAFDTAARAAILIDFRNGDVLFEKNADVPLPPASMSKLMTALMVFERLREGSLKLDDTLPVSARAWRTGGSKMFVEVDTRVRVDDLLRGMIIQSGNDACIVFAESLAGSEEAFAEQMTVRARELGLTNTKLKNSTGLPDPEHKMSVRDLARLASHIIREFPEYYAIYGELDFEFNNIRQANRNPLLQAGIEGVDGVKTGHTSEAGYGLVASAIRGDRRLVLVVAGLDSIRQRRAEAERLLEHGFRDFIEYRVFEAGAAVAEANVWLGAASTLPLVPAEPVAVTLTRETRRDLAVKLRYKDWVPAPVARGDRLGEVVIELPGRDPIEVPLVAGADVEEAGMLGRLTGLVQHLVLGP